VHLKIDLLIGCHPFSNDLSLSFVYTIFSPNKGKIKENKNCIFMSTFFPFPLFAVKN
jgi:hypothetical protein